jgi:hypothetical protein
MLNRYYSVMGSKEQRAREKELMRKWILDAAREFVHPAWL